MYKNGYGDTAPPSATAAPIQQNAAFHNTLGPVESAGYRKKRNNAYGDEAVPPTAIQNINVPTPSEHVPARSGQSYGAAPAPIESSGYRKK